MNHDSAIGEIVIAPYNEMKGAYTVIGANHSQTMVEIYVRAIRFSNIDTNIEIRAIDNSTTLANMDVKYRGNSDIAVEIQPIGFDSIDIELEVSPNNSMWVLYDIQEPPRIVTTLNPIKDSFTRGEQGYESINYGDSSSLLVGGNSDKQYSSFIEFNFSSWLNTVSIVDAKLKLYYSDVVPENSEIEIYKVDEYWNEYGITHLNQPYIGEKYVDNYKINEQERYVEFDITSLVSDWINNEIENYGLVLYSDLLEDYIRFRSRESSRPPELTVTYFDTKIYSAGINNLPIEIFVMEVGSGQVDAEIEVSSVFDVSSICTELYVHRYDTPVSCGKEVEIGVTKDKVDTEILVGIREDKTLYTELEVAIKGHDVVDAEINVSKNIVESEIFVPYGNEIDAEVLISRVEDSSKKTELTITKEFTIGEIFVAHKEFTEAEINVQQFESNSTLSEIAVTRQKVETEVLVRVEEDRDIDTEIIVIVTDDSLTEAELAITREFIPVEIEVIGHSDIYSEIFVKYADFISSQIDIKSVEQRITLIDIKKTDSLYTKITVSKDRVEATINVPYWDDSYIISEIHPRVLQVDDTIAEITVEKDGGSYAFII